jgi:hypothetical protein
MSFSFLEDYKITSGQIENLGVKSTGRLFATRHRQK